MNINKFLSISISFIRIIISIISINSYISIGFSQNPSKIDVLLQALEVVNEDTNKVNILVQLSEQYRLLNIETAMKYDRQALKLSQKINYKLGMAISLNNIGINFAYQGSYDKALENCLKSLKIIEKVGDKQELASYLNNIGVIYKAQGDYNNAIEYFQRALKIRRELDDKKDIIISLNNIGIIYEAKGDSAAFAKADAADKYDKAIKYFNESLSIAKEIGEKNIVKEVYQNLSEIYRKINRFKEALKYQKQYSAIKDSLFNEESNQRIIEIEAKYENEKKQKKIELLAKENEIKKIKITKNRYLVFGLIGVLLVIVIAFLFIQKYKLRSRQKNIVLEQKLLRSQMNPHFIFNSLTAIQSYLFKKNPVEAGKYLASFAKLIRLILENSREEYITLEKEIKILENYLILQQLRFENKFEYNLDVDPNINIETMAIPPMLTQPFIENSLEHGIMHKGIKGMINIRFNLINNVILFELQDNGIGRKKAKELKKNSDEPHKSIGTAITEERISILNKKNRKKIKLNIIDLKDKNDNAQGTKVVVSIPFRNA